MHDDKGCSGILSGSYWQHCDFLHGAILTEDLLAQLELLYISFGDLSGFSPHRSSSYVLRVVLGCFDYHVTVCRGMSWYVMVT